MGRCHSSLSGDHRPKCSASCGCRPAHRQCKARAAELSGNACAAPDCSCIAPRSPARGLACRMSPSQSPRLPQPLSNQRRQHCWWRAACGAAMALIAVTPIPGRKLADGATGVARQHYWRVPLEVVADGTDPLAGAVFPNIHLGRATLQKTGLSLRTHCVLAPHYGAAGSGTASGTGARGAATTGASEEDIGPARNGRRRRALAVSGCTALGRCPRKNFFLWFFGPVIFTRSSLLGASMNSFFSFWNDFRRKIYEPAASRVG